MIVENVFLPPWSSAIASTTTTPPYVLYLSFLHSLIFLLSNTSCSSSLSSTNISFFINNSCNGLLIPTLIGSWPSLRVLPTAAYQEEEELGLSILTMAFLFHTGVKFSQLYKPSCYHCHPLTIPCHQVTTFITNILEPDLYSSFMLS